MISRGEAEVLFEAQTRSSYFVTAYFPRGPKIPQKTRAFLEFLRLQITPGAAEPARAVQE
jgi:hypothetical protein